MTISLFSKLAIHGRLIRNLVRNTKFWCVLFGDIALLVLAHYLAYAVRFDVFLPAGSVGAGAIYTDGMVAIQILRRVFLRVTAKLDYLVLKLH